MDDTNAHLTAKERRALKRAALQPSDTSGQLDVAGNKPALQSKQEEPRESSDQSVVAAAQSGDAEGGLTSKERRALKRQQLQTEYISSSAEVPVTTQEEEGVGPSTAVSAPQSSLRGPGSFFARSHSIGPGSSQAGRGSAGGRSGRGNGGRGGGGRSGPQFKGFDNRPPLPRPIPQGPISTSALMLKKGEEEEDGEKSGIAAKPRNNPAAPPSAGKGKGKGKGGGGKGSGSSGKESGKKWGPKRPKNNKELRALFDRSSTVQEVLKLVLKNEASLGDDDFCHALHCCAHLAKADPFSQAAPWSAEWVEEGEPSAGVSGVSGAAGVAPLSGWAALSRRMREAAPFLAARSLTKAMHSSAILDMAFSSSGSSSSSSLLDEATTKSEEPFVVALALRVGALAADASAAFQKAAAALTTAAGAAAGKAAAPSLDPASVLSDGALDPMATASCLWALGKVFGKNSGSSGGSSSGSSSGGGGGAGSSASDPSDEWADSSSSSSASALPALLSLSVVESLLSCSTFMAPLFNPQDLGNALWGLARLLKVSQVAELGNTLVSAWRSFETAALARTSSLLNGGQTSKGSGGGGGSGSIAHEFKGQELADCLWGLATLQASYLSGSGGGGNNDGDKANGGSLGLGESGGGSGSSVEPFSLLGSDGDTLVALLAAECGFRAKSTSWGSSSSSSSAARTSSSPSALTPSHMVRVIWALARFPFLVFDCEKSGATKTKKEKKPSPAAVAREKVPDAFSSLVSSVSSSPSSVLNSTSIGDAESTNEAELTMLLGAANQILQDSTSLIPHTSSVSSPVAMSASFSLAAACLRFTSLHVSSLPPMVLVRAFTTSTAAATAAASPSANQMSGDLVEVVATVASVLMKEASSRTTAVAAAGGGGSSWNSRQFGPTAIAQLLRAIALAPWATAAPFDQNNYLQVSSSAASTVAKKSTPPPPLALSAADCVHRLVASSVAPGTAAACLSSAAMASSNSAGFAAFSPRDLSEMLWSLGRLAAGGSMNTSGESSENFVQGEAGAEVYAGSLEASPVALLGAAATSAMSASFGSGSVIRCAQLRLSECFTATLHRQQQQQQQKQQQVSAQSVANSVWALVGLCGFLESELVLALVNTGGGDYYGGDDGDIVDKGTGGGGEGGVRLCGGQLAVSDFRPREAASLLWALARLDHPALRYNALKATTIDTLLEKKPSSKKTIFDGDVEDDNKADAKGGGRGVGDHDHDDCAASSRGGGGGDGTRLVLALCAHVSSHASSIRPKYSMTRAHCGDSGSGKGGDVFSSAGGVLLLLSDVVDVMWASAKLRPPETTTPTSHNGDAGIADNQDDVRVRQELSRSAARFLVAFDSLSSSSSSESRATTSQVEPAAHIPTNLVATLSWCLSKLKVFKVFVTEAPKPALTRGAFDILCGAICKACATGCQQQQQQQQQSLSGLQLGLVAWAVAQWPRSNNDGDDSSSAAHTPEDIVLVGQAAVHNDGAVGDLSRDNSGAQGEEGTASASLRVARALASSALLQTPSPSSSSSSSSSQHSMNAQTVAHLDFLLRAQSLFHESSESSSLNESQASMADDVTVNHQGGWGTHLEEAALGAVASVGASAGRFDAASLKALKQALAANDAQAKALIDRLLHPPLPTTPLPQAPTPRKTAHPTATAAAVGADAGADGKTLLTSKERRLAKRAAQRQEVGEDVTSTSPVREGGAGKAGQVSRLLVIGDPNPDDPTKSFANVILEAVAVAGASAASSTAAPLVEVVHFNRFCSGTSVAGALWPPLLDSDGTMKRSDKLPSFDACVLRLPSTGDTGAIDFAIAAAFDALTTKPSATKPPTSTGQGAARAGGDSGSANGGGLLWVCGTRGEGVTAAATTLSALRRRGFVDVRVCASGKNSAHGGGVVTARAIAAAAAAAASPTAPTSFLPLDRIAPFSKLTTLNLPVDTLFPPSPLTIKNESRLSKMTNLSQRYQHNTSGGSVTTAADANSVLTLPWVVYPGLFAGGRLDVMTAFMLKHLPTSFASSASSSSSSLSSKGEKKAQQQRRVLDFACGSGVIAAAVALRFQTLSTGGSSGVDDNNESVVVDGFDADAVAVEACKQNLGMLGLLDPSKEISDHGSDQGDDGRGGRVILSNSWKALTTTCSDHKDEEVLHHDKKRKSAGSLSEEAGSEGATAMEGVRRYDWILSNPPLHNGKCLDLGVVKYLVEGASSCLKPQGSLFIVTQNGVPVGPLLTKVFNHTKKQQNNVTVVTDGRFALWRAMWCGNSSDQSGDGYDDSGGGMGQEHASKKRQQPQKKLKKSEVEPAQEETKIEKVTKEEKKRKKKDASQQAAVQIAEPPSDYNELTKAQKEEAVQDHKTEEEAKKKEKKEKKKKKPKFTSNLSEKDDVNSNSSGGGSASAKPAAAAPIPKFCGQCGSSLQVAITAAAQGGKPPRFCFSCGAPIIAVLV